jgi:hypothetical protein
MTRDNRPILGQPGGDCRDVGTAQQDKLAQRGYARRLAQRLKEPGVKDRYALGTATFASLRLARLQVGDRGPSPPSTPEQYPREDSSAVRLELWTARAKRCS